MACRICPVCDRHWPVRNANLTCPFCCVTTRWSGDEPSTKPADESFAERVVKNVTELASDIAELERYAAGSARLLSFPVCLNRWPTASDVPGRFIQGGGEAEAHPAAP